MISCCPAPRARKGDVENNYFQLIGKQTAALNPSFLSKNQHDQAVSCVHYWGGPVASSDVKSDYRIEAGLAGVFMKAKETNNLGSWRAVFPWASSTTFKTSFGCPRWNIFFSTSCILIVLQRDKPPAAGRLQRQPRLVASRRPVSVACLVFKWIRFLIGTKNSPEFIHIGSMYKFSTN